MHKQEELSHAKLYDLGIQARLAQEIIQSQYRDISNIINKCIPNKINDYEIQCFTIINNNYEPYYDIHLEAISNKSNTLNRFGYAMNLYSDLDTLMRLNDEQRKDWIDMFNRHFEYELKGILTKIISKINYMEE